MSLGARVEWLRALSITAGYMPTQVLMGAAERAELNEIVQKIATTQSGPDVATYLGLIIIDVAAPYCLMVGTVTREGR